jgi:hypothetical protein
VGFLLAGTQAGHALPLPRTSLLPTEIGSIAGRFPYRLPKTRVVCCSMSVHCSPPCVVEITKWSTNDGIGLAVKALALVVLHQEVGTSGSRVLEVNFAGHSRRSTTTSLQQLSAASTQAQSHTRFPMPPCCSPWEVPW